MLRRFIPRRSYRGVCLLLLMMTLLPLLLYFKNLSFPSVPEYILAHPYFHYDIDSEGLRDNVQKCSLPRIHPFHPSIWSYLTPPKPIVCVSRRGNWTYIDHQGRLMVNNTAIAENGYVIGKSLNCFWSPVLRAGPNEEDDLKVKYGNESYLPPEGVILPSNIEVVRATCQNFAFFKIYEKIHAHIRNVTFDSSRAAPLHHPINIFIFGLDSLARTAFIRHLPHTYRYLTEDLNMTVFRGMNKVGDNSYPNLIAILTGDKAYGGGLPDYKKGFDGFPLVWNNYTSAGYATMFAEDFPEFGLFTYLATGFRKVPTLHYFRPFWLAVKESNLFKFSSHLCYGPTPMHWLQVDYVDRFISRYEDRKIPYFGFSFLAEISHDYVSPVASADDYFLEFFKSLFERGYLNNTFFIVMSDHGHRFDPIRKTEIGYIEERMPFFAIRVPDAISSHQPSVRETFRENSRRLITPFDVHATLLDLFSFATRDQPLGQYAPKNTLGLSLFGSIPADRTCADAHVPVHYCVCETKTSIPVTDSRSVIAGHAIIKHINTLISDAGSEFSERCAFLVLKEVKMAHLVRKTEDPPTNGSEKVRVVVQAKPSDAMLEATVLYQDGRTEIIGDVSRINPYGDQSICIKHMILRKYCFCRDNERTLKGKR
ncbi:uncharacterized protein LOC129227306 [Uloborus diversus]|uniref:uncharacterized protein LOC129227306 n=1 Tax=Uloborus diversus TaxID=327109 RepID=UPI002409159D|nr:uncharacterized protein LOC129227306 [Uloborus diversus]